MNRRIIKKNKGTSNKLGFTLIEIMIVSAVITATFTAIYAVYFSVMKYDTESRYEIIASNLAQEGIEIVRNMRDKDAMSGSANWADHINLSGSNYIPFIDGSGNPTVQGTTNKNVYLNASPRYMNCTSGCSGTLQPFSRSLSFDNTNYSGGNGYIKVTCIVTWDSFSAPGVTRRVEATSVFTGWQ